MIDDENVIISKNPAYTDQENEEYERSGTVPIVGVTAMAGNIVTPDKLRRMVKSIEGGNGQEQTREMSKRAKDLGYKQASFDFMKDDDLSKPKDITNTAVEVKDKDMMTKYGAPAQADNVILPNEEASTKKPKQRSVLKRANDSGEKICCKQSELKKSIDDMSHNMDMLNARMRNLEYAISKINEAIG